MKISGDILALHLVNKKMIDLFILRWYTSSNKWGGF